MLLKTHAFLYSMRSVVVFVVVLILAACAVPAQQYSNGTPQEVNFVANETNQTLARATFAGGCFWCMEPPFENAPGVLEVYSGYTGGEENNPTYKEVSAGATGHYEAVEIVYDPQQISYEDLLEIFWRNIDPTDADGQFVDRGNQYRNAIFYHDDEQKRIAEESRAALEASQRFDKPIVTNILPYDEFFLAEEYHQDYYKKSSVRYSTYRRLSGRDQFLDKIWGDEPHGKHAYEAIVEWAKPSDEELKATLTPLQYEVTQEDSTEPAFNNEYWNNTEEGIYVDILTGEPLFSSTHKYKSGTGWPSFTQPLESQNIVEKKDYKLVLPRTEVRSKLGDNHLGHVFDDGPEPTGLRYCMNSAALRFVPKEKLAEEGYGRYLELF